MSGTTLLSANRTEIMPELESRTLRLALAGGGTGGHLVPGLHLLEEAQRRGGLADLVWFTSGREVEDRVLQGMERRFPLIRHERVVLEVEPRGGGAPSRARLILRTPASVASAHAALRAHKPDVLLALGGFTSLPAVLAARMLRIPIVLLEINAERGAATRWLGGMADHVAHAWEATLPAAGVKTGRTRHRRIGPPLAREFSRGMIDENSSARAREELGFDPALPLLLVLGGSQGALGLNRFVHHYAPELVRQGVQVLHQTGPGRTQEALAPFRGYAAQEYIHDMARALSAATLVLTRGGASTLAEIAALRRPAVVVPYPHHADKHQEKNALQLKDGVRIVEERELGPQYAEELARLCSRDGSAARARMSAALEAALPLDGAGRLLDTLLELANQRRAR